MYRVPEKELYEKKIWQKNYPHFLPDPIECEHQSAIEIFEKSAVEKPQSPAFYYFDDVFTYGDINSMANSFAAGLSDLDVKKGDRVILQLQNIPQYLIGLYGIWKLGAIAVTLNPMYKERELEFYCNDSGAKIIVTMESCYEEVKNLLVKTPLQNIITTSELDYINSDPLPKVLNKAIKKKFQGAFDMQDLLLKYSGCIFKSVPVAPEDVGYLTYTSGTTGPPKGAMNTHGNIVFSTNVYYKACNFSNKDVVVGVAPFYHVTGGIGHLGVASLAGVPVIGFFRFEPSEVIRLIEKWKASMMIAPLTVYIALLSHPDIIKRDISSLTKLLSGGAPVPEGFVKKFKEVCGSYIHNWYGLTESTSPLIINPLGASSPVDPETGALSIGVPVPNSTVRIQDVKTGAVLPSGEIGEIVAKGPMIVPGYWNKPEENKNAFKDGYFYTGDVGMMDENGWFYFVDRSKDLINVSGYKVWPREVEDVLYQHDAIKEVSVIGVPDPYRGETIKAFVILEKGHEDTIGADELIDFCKQRMAAYKYPRIIEIVENIPQTHSGKALKRQLRENEYISNNSNS